MDIYQFIKDKLEYDPNGKCINAFQILSNPEILVYAYNSIKSNPGNMVHGSDQETLDGLSMKWIKDVSNSLITESYDPKPARRVYIPKSNGKMRPLGISSPRDKIIQQAMKLVIEVILEPKFKNSSHGFRPNRGCHTALREIRNWKGLAWFIEGDIKSFFDNIDHNILESLIKKHFNEARLIHLYWKFVKAGYMEWDTSKMVYVSTDVGVPQGGIISPILSNLILDELDEFMDKLIKGFDIRNKGIKPYLKNPEYHKWTMRINRLKKKIINLKSEQLNYKLELKEYRKSIKTRRLIKSLIPNPDMNKITYVRYADDWIIGVWGKKTLAQGLKKQISEKLNSLKLELSLEKTLITNARSDRAKFLGTFIKKMASNKSSVMVRTYDNKAKRRLPTGNIWMTAPILELVKKLEEKGFLKRKGFFWRPLSIGKFTLLPIRDIILRFNSILQGVMNYYSFCDNRLKLNKIHWILKESLRKTISRKLKINKTEFLYKFGNNITHKFTLENDRERIISFKSPDLIRNPMRFFGTAKFTDPFAIVSYKISTINPFNMLCASCNSQDNIEMHHVKHIKTINPKLSPFDKMMAKINRKQVPLCRKCHMDIHAGRYNGKSLKYLLLNKKKRM